MHRKQCALRITVAPYAERTHGPQKQATREQARYINRTRETDGYHVSADRRFLRIRSGQPSMTPGRGDFSFPLENQPRGLRAKFDRTFPRILAPSQGRKPKDRDRVARGWPGANASIVMPRTLGGCSRTYDNNTKHLSGARHRGVWSQSEVSVEIQGTLSAAQHHSDSGTATAAGGAGGELVGELFSLHDHQVVLAELVLPQGEEHLYQQPVWRRAIRNDNRVRRRSVETFGFTHPSIDLAGSLQARCQA